MTAVPAPSRPTANDRLKERWPSFLWGSMTVAVAAHALVFALWPRATVASDGGRPEVPEIIRMDDIDIPEPPEILERPAPPVPSADAPDDVVIAPFDSIWREPPLPTPPPEPGDEAAPLRGFVPYTVAPRVLNAAEVLRAAEREYPAALRDAGIGGTVALLVQVSEDGEVVHVEVGASSGHPALDRAALRVAEVLRMSPAMNRDRRVAVLTRVPIVFRVR